MDQKKLIESWDLAVKSLSKDAALVILDTADEYNIGELRALLPYAQEVFVIDHHETNNFCSFSGFFDNTASSTCEMVVELAEKAQVIFSKNTAMAAYSGIVYDTGSFSYSKTTTRTFKAALNLLEAGADPYEVYRALNENASNNALFLHKAVLSSLEVYNEGRVAVQILRKEDLESTGAPQESSDNFVNIPMRSKEILVSVIIKESKDGKVRCSLRSKGPPGAPGSVNVSRIAQSLGGGGHVCAAGFKSSLGIDETLVIVMEKVNGELEKL